MKVSAALSPHSTVCATGAGSGAHEGHKPVEALVVIAVDLGPTAAQLDEFELAPANENVGQ